MPEVDFHHSDPVRLRAHERGLSSPLMGRELSSEQGHRRSAPDHSGLKLLESDPISTSDGKLQPHRNTSKNKDLRWSFRSDSAEAGGHRGGCRLSRGFGDDPLRSLP